MEKFRKKVWGKALGRKKKYYIEEFNPTCDLQQKEFIGASISWRAEVLIAQLRTNSHQLCCETRRWKRPKEVWRERVYIFCSFEKVKTEKHFILECNAKLCNIYKDTTESYANILAASSWDNLFKRGVCREEKLCKYSSS